MTRSARAFFLSRALREKLLLVAFVGIGALWWASTFLTRANIFWRDQRATTAQLKEQAEWIKNQKMIEETEKKTVEQLDRTKTLNGNQLVTQVSQLATDAGLKNTQTVGGTSSKTSGQLALHSQEFVMRNVEWEPLKAFYEAIQKRSRYIAIERFTLSSAPGNSAQLTLQLKATSLEITR